MKSTLIAFTIALSLILTPLQGIHAATTADNTALIQKLLAQIVLLQAELTKLTGNTAPCTFTRTLYIGTTGTDVTCLQTYLKKKGHLQGTATGYYGPITKEAVYKWQQSAGIVPEPKAIGMFGPRSQETLVREMRTTAPIATTNTTPNTTNTTPRTTNGGGGNTPRTTTDTTRTPRSTPPVVTTDTTKPTLPTNLTAVANSSSQITLSWTASTDAGGLKGYNIYRVGTAAPINATPQTGTTFTQTGLNPSTAYTYQVEAIDNAGNKSMKTASVSKTTLALSTVIDTTKPTTPGTPTASLVTQTTLKLTWTASTDAGGSNLTGYKVFRNGTQIGTPTTNTYNDANLTANTAYSYTVVAYDGAGNTSATSSARNTTTLTAVTPPVTTVPPITTTIPAPAGNSASWNTLCAQSGIFVCDNFSDRSTGKITAGFSKAFIENGNLVFTIPSNSNANAGGEYRQSFPAIGEGKFVAFSYRIKADAAALNIESPGRKEFIMWRGASSCTDLQLVQTHNGSKPVLVPYTDCGARGFTSKIPNSGGNIQWHYPDFDCKYHAVKAGDYTGCAISHADQWENFYVEVQVGNYKQPNSSVTMWYKPDNGTWKRYIATSTYAFNGTGGFEHFMLTIYMTGKDTSIAHPEGRVYYDHLIMSTKPFNVDQFLSATMNPITNAAVTPSVPASTPPPLTPVSVTPTTTVVVAPVPTGPRTVSVVVPPLPAPSSNPAPSLASQIASIKPGQWGKISGDNNATDVDPGKEPAINTRHPSNAPWHGGSGYKGMFEAWNSGGLATNFGPCGSILHYGGGHNDYWGNQVTALNLCGGVSGGPVWQRLSNPYKDIIVWPATDGAFPDGTPSPAHTYDTLTVGNNKMMVFNAQSTNGPTHVPSAFIFDLANRTWTGPLTHLGNSHGASAWDTRRNLAWNVPSYSSTGGKFSSFDPVSQTFTNYFKTNVSPFISNIDSMMAYDPDNDKLVITNFRSSGTSLAEIDPANPNTRPVIVSQIGKPVSDEGQHAFAWSAKRHAFIVWMDAFNDGKVWEVKRMGLNASGTLEYSWTLLTDVGNTVMPVTTSHNGSYDKFQIVTVGGDEVLIGQLRLQDGIYAFKIPAPGVAARPTRVPLTNAESRLNLLQDLLRQLKVLQDEVKKLKQ